MVPENFQSMLNAPRSIRSIFGMRMINILPIQTSRSTCSFKTGFSYIPRNGNINGTIKEYIFYTSNDGSTWNIAAEGEFENIKNNPVEQKVYFAESLNSRYIKLEALSEINGNPWASAAEIGIITK